MGVNLSVLAFFFLLVLVFFLAGRRLYLLVEKRRFGKVERVLSLFAALLLVLFLGGMFLEVITDRQYWGPAPLRTLEPVSAKGGSLQHIATVGDLDKDGSEDLGAVTSLPGPNGNRHELVVFSGRNGQRLLHTEFETPFPTLCMTLAGVGDLDTDGSADLVVGCRSAPKIEARSPQIQVRSGRDGALIRTWTEPQVQEGHELSVADAGDVDGDRFGDILVGSALFSGSGVVWLHSGRDGALLETLEGDSNAGRFGAALLALGDVDSDGTGDFAVSSIRGRPGRVQAFSGSSRKELWRVAAQTANSDIGEVLDLVDDRDADGMRDLMVGGGMKDFLMDGEHASLLVSARTGAILQVFENSAVTALLDDWDGDGQPEILQLAWGGESRFYDHPIYSHIEVIGSQGADLLAELSFPGPPIFSSSGYVTVVGEGSDSFAVLRGDRILQFSKACFLAE